jgi:hypothetical protein
MTVYLLCVETAEGERRKASLSFTDDDAAIAYVLHTARGTALELWRGTRLIATVDERPCIAQAA